MRNQDLKKDELYFIELGWQAQKGDLALEWNFTECDVLRISPLRDFYAPVLFHQNIALLLDIAREEFCETKSPLTLAHPIHHESFDEDEDDIFDFGNHNSFSEAVSDGFLSDTQRALDIHEQLFYFEIGAYGFCAYLTEYLKLNYSLDNLKIQEYLHALNTKASERIESFSKYGNLDNAEWYTKLKKLQILSIHDVLIGLNTIEDENNLHLKQLLTYREELNHAIEAASDLQTALLPLNETLENSFSEIFTYHKPKFKVGGDFYFYHEVEGTKIIACCDCTGHGVRAAMLSVLINKFFYQHIVIEKINDPVQILKEINHHLFYFLNRNLLVEQNIGEINFNELDYTTKLRDSMDVSICAINNHTQTITICSTKQNVILIEPTNNTYIFDPRTVSLGDLQHQKEFKISTLSIPLTKNLGIILASDGLVDQFGGPNGKKLGSKKYKQLVDRILQQNNFRLNSLSIYYNIFFYLWTDWHFTRELAEIANIPNSDHDPIDTICQIFTHMNEGRLADFFLNIEQFTQPRQEQIDDILILGFKI